MIRRLWQRNTRGWVYIALLLALAVARLLVAYCQRVFLMTEGAGLDDMLMVRAAQSLAEGGWLGAYGGFAIAKNMGFALWLWLLHVLRVPLLVGNCLLWLAACGFAVRALRPLFPGNLVRAGLFAFLAFNPVSYTFFNLRAYRDGIFPAFCLLLFAGAVGLALRLSQRRARGSLLMAVGAGVGLAGAWLLREDGAVLLVFAVCALGFVAGFALFHPVARGRLAKLACSFVPFGVLAAGILAFSAANYAHYGVFMVNDLSSGSFPKAYGAMVGVSRAEDGFTGKTPVTRDALERLFTASPSLALLQEDLLHGPAFNGFGDAETGEFGGSFYFALRMAADEAGLTPDAVTAQSYWQRVAEEISGAVAAGSLQSAGSTASVVPRFDTSLVLPTVQETVYGGLKLLLFEDANPRPYESLGDAEAAGEVAAFLHAKVQTGYVAGTTEPYYNPLQRAVFWLLDRLTTLYTFAVTPMLLYAVWQTGRALALGVQSAMKKKGVPPWLLAGVLNLGLLLSFFLRLVVAAYMEVASFGIGTYVMYLASAMPALLLACAVGVGLRLCLPAPGRRIRAGLLQRRHGRADLRRWVVAAAVLGLVAAKLLLAGAQSVYLALGDAPLDDAWAVETAMNITAGDWLGAYGPLTLAKHSLYSVWLAVLHAIGMPALWGGQLLWALAAGAAAAAFLPILKRRWLGLLLFFVLLFSPSSVANSAPYGYITRLYRDNIFPALCLLCVAGMVGYALRYRGDIQRSWWWLAVCGVGILSCWLCREDGWWLAPFLLGAVVVCAVTVLRSDAGQKRLKCLALGLPFVLLAAGLAGWAGMNQAHYGRFVLNDFSSGEFADAYGAMTRVQHADWNPKVAVPADVRRQLYDHVPAFAELEGYLESDWYHSRYAAGDYTSGAFYWALREAAAEAGYYDSPETAAAYFAQLAGEINALCDAGVLDAGPGRSSVNPPIRAAYIAPVTAEALHSLWYVLRFEGCDARSLLSLNDSAVNAPVEAYVHQRALVAAREGTSEPYFTPLQQYAFRFFDAVQDGYAMLAPPAFLLALAASVMGGVRFFRRLRKRRRNGWDALVWLVGLSLLACAVLRCFMIAFVTVSSFTIGTYVMYLASVHPFVLCYAFVGSVLVVRSVQSWLSHRRAARAFRVEGV